MSGGNNFLVDDPDWAIDFAPNGTFWSEPNTHGTYSYSLGVLLKFNDTMTRKRYAEYVLIWKIVWRPTLTKL